MLQHIMKTFLLFISLGLFTATSSFGQSNDEAAIRKILGEQVTSWNNGQLKKFMQGYWQSDSLKFIGKTGVTYGWNETLKNYIKRYPDTTAMGKLTFNIIEVNQLSPLYIFVIGKWDLTRTIGNLSGHFTLLFKKIYQQWLIIADHSS